MTSVEENNVSTSHIYLYFSPIFLQIYIQIIVLFTTQHLFECFSYSAGSDFRLKYA